MQSDALIVIAGAFEIGPRQTHVLAGTFAHRDAAVTTGAIELAWVSASAASASAPSGPAIVPETRRNEELREALFELGRFDVAIETALELLLNAFEQMRLRTHHATAQKDA